VVANLHRGHYRPHDNKSNTHPGEQERMQNMKMAISVTAFDYARSTARPSKPAPLPYRYDSRLEVVTLYSRSRQTDQQFKAPANDVDRLLDK
jgi:hypothetical protein